MEVELAPIVDLFPTVNIETCHPALEALAGLVNRDSMIGTAVVSR